MTTAAPLDLPAPMSIAIFHNIVWSKYKGTVFSCLHRTAQERGVNIEFHQIAETESDRVNLASVDRSYHTYPFKLHFLGAYEAVPLWRRWCSLGAAVWRSKARLIVMPGYHLSDYWLMLICAKLRGRRAAVFCDSTAYDKKQRAVRGLAKRLFFSLCDGYFAYGQRSKEYLVSYGARPDRVFQRCQAAALPHDYDVERSQEQRLALMRQAPQEAFRLLFVGRLAPEKRLDLLLKAVQQLRGTRHLELNIIGSGPLSEVLQSMARELGVDDVVHFLGSKQTEAIAQHYQSTHFLVLPSDREPWGLVVNEAMSYGCPVIVSSNCGCVPELVLQGRGGVVFEAGSVEDLQAKLLLVTAHPFDTVGWMERSLETISHYTPDRAAEQILSGCRRILE